MRDLLGRLWGAHALAWIGCFAFLGVRLADWLRQFFPAFAAVFFGLLVIGSAIWFWLAKHRSGPALLTLTLGVFGLSLLCHSAAMRSLPGIERIDQNQSLYVEVSGFIDAVPTTAEGDDSRFFVPFRLEWMREIGSEQKVPTSARVRLIGRGETPQYGECLQFRGFLKRPKSPRNPGEFDAEEYLRIRRMPAELRAAGDYIVDEGRVGGSAVSKLAFKIRDHVELALTKGLEEEPKAATTIVAMVLGEKAGAEESVLESFRRSGTMHVFAVSGLHVGIVALISNFAFGLIGLPKRMAALGVIPTVFFYAFLTGLSPSAVRAAIMASIWFLGIAVGRKPVLLNTLGATAGIILAVDPFFAFNGGFQLSFLVVGSIAIFARLVQQPFRGIIDPDPFIPKALLTRGQKAKHTVYRRCGDTAGVSFSAWLGSAVPIFFFFNIVTPVALLANCVLVPLAFIILGFAAVSLIASVLFLGSLSTVVNQANAYVANGTTWAVKQFAEVPGGHFFVETPRLPFESDPKLTVFDLTSGGAAKHLSLGGSKGDWLFDCGDQVAFSGTVFPGLRDRGVTQISGVFLSHRDIDHVGGAIDLFSQLPTGSYIESVPKGGSVNSMVREAAEEKGVERRLLYPGTAYDLEGGKHRASVEILYPLEDDYASVSDDRCSVIMLTCREWRVLLMSDAGFRAEKWLLENGVDVSCDVIVKNWHGSDFSGLPEFLQAASPKAVVVSNATFLTGEKMPSGFPGIVSGLGIELIDQSKTGAVTILMGKRELKLRPFLSESEGFSIRR